MINVHKTQFLRVEKQITDWLDAHGVYNFELIPSKKYNFVVNVDASVDLSIKNLTCIPVKFNEIKGHFDCGDNALENLDFCPKNVHGEFVCSYNALENLDFCPDYVELEFYCDGNPKLGELQDISNFEDIKKKYSEIKNIKNEQAFLENVLNEKDLKINPVLKI